MKKYFILFLLPLALFACTPKTATTGETPKPTNTEFDATPPGEIKWTGSGGRSFTGTFDRWKFNKLEVPKNDFTKVEAEIAVDISSVNVNPDGLENHLREHDYLDAKGHPVAIVKFKGAIPMKDGAFLAKSTVSLKGAESEVPITFYVTGSDVRGTATLFRKSHKVGDEDGGVKNEVPIEFSFKMPK